MDNDYELVFLAQEKDEIANEILYNKYKRFLNIRAKKYYNFFKKYGLEFEDILQEIMLAFESSINCFNQESDASFFTFANTCINKAVGTLLEKCKRDRNKALNDALCIDNREEGSLLEILGDFNTPESKLIEEENFNLLFNKIDNKLTFSESVVFKLKINGYDYHEISDVLDVDIKSVYNYIRSIKHKIKKNCRI